MHIHIVFFWLHDGANRTEFEQALQELVGIDHARTGYWGTPAETGSRDVVDDSYDYSITLLFDTLADHDAYQASPGHVAFVDANQDKWHRVQVYDVATRDTTDTK